MPMRVISIENITYKLKNSVDPYTLPVALTLNVDNNFNKYTDVAKIIKELIGYDVLHYTITDNVADVTNTNK